MTKYYIPTSQFQFQKREKACPHCTSQSWQVLVASKRFQSFRGHIFENKNIKSRLLLKAITNVGENVGEEEPLYTVSGNADWYSHYRKQQWRFLEKLRLELPHDPDTPLLSIYVKNMKTQIRKDMCSLCSWQQYLRWSRQGNHLSAHQHINGSRGYMYTHTSSIVFMYVYAYTCAYNGILLNNKKYEIFLICKNMGRPWGY